MIGDTIYQCPCGSKEFMETFQVKQFAAGGSGKTHAGYKCAECGTAMSKRAFSNMEKKRQAEEQLRQAEQTLRELEVYGTEDTEKKGKAPKEATI